MILSIVLTKVICLLFLKVSSELLALGIVDCYHFFLKINPCGVSLDLLADHRKCFSTNIYDNSLAKFCSQ